MAPELFRLEPRDTILLLFLFKLKSKVGQFVLGFLHLILHHACLLFCLVFLLVKLAVEVLLANT